MRILIVAASLFLFASYGCTSSSKKSRPGYGGWGAQGPGAVSGPISNHPGAGATAPAQGNEDFQELRSLFADGSHETLIQKARLFERKHPKSPLLNQTENLQGLAYLFLKQPKEAIRHFKRSIALNPEGPIQVFSNYVMYNLATALADSGLIDEAQQTLSKSDPESLDRENRIKFHYLRARLYFKQTQFKESAREALLASRLLNDPDSQSGGEAKIAVRAFLERSLQEIKIQPILPILQDLYREFEDSVIADVILFRIGSEEARIGNTGDSEYHLRALTARFPQTPYYSQATDLLRATQTNVVVDNHSIGILLPLTGNFGKFGERCLQSVELAFNVFNANEADAKISLVVEDSGDEPEQGVAALNRLVTKHHVIAVIGPLLSKGTEQISRRAQELGVPLLSISRHPGIPSDFVFSAGLTLKLQAEELARYAIEELKLKKFAIIAPKNKSGDEVSQNFWEAVESRGGKIVGSESYIPGETDFRQVVDKLSGLYFTEARQRELDDMTKKREENNIKKRTRKTEQFFSLKPIVDYEAIFIPDEPKIAGQIFPTFAYRDVDKMKFLGTSVWNTQELVTRAQNYVENASFVDAFFGESASPHVRKFVERYKSMFDSDPTVMEALAFDAAGLLDYTFNSGAWPLTRNEVRDRLKDVRNYRGITGDISFRDGSFFRTLKFLTVRHGRIVEVN